MTTIVPIARSRKPGQPDEFFAVTPTAGNALRISPTDVSQFLRLEQCQRYLRLRLHERSGHYNFLREAGAYPQSIPPLLTRSGAAFEQVVERDIAARYPTHDFGTTGQRGGDRDASNARVVALARGLPPGHVLVLFQPRLLVELGAWLVRGDVDILRLERDAATGELRALIADLKSSTSAKVEHRLQVAFYHEMLAALFARDGVACAGIEMAVLYRGPSELDPETAPEEWARREEQLRAAEDVFGTRAGLLEPVADPESYRGAVADLVTDPQSAAALVARAPFDAVPFTLSAKCDGCLYNEFCMTRSARTDDLSLLPHLTGQDKGALLRHGVATTSALAALKTLPPRTVETEGEPGRPSPPSPLPRTGERARPVDPRLGSGGLVSHGAGVRAAVRADLAPAPGQEELVRRLSATWPVGPRLDELIHRARQYRRFAGDPIEALPYIPHRGYGSLPYADAAHNPNLVRVYVDAQQDYLQDRLYLLGALVVACEDGVPAPARRRGIVRLADGPPEAPGSEEDLVAGWVADTIRAIVELAAPDGDGQARAPIHVIFYNELAQRLLLDGLGRHATRVLGATPLYDFVTQLAGFDSPVATTLERELRELRNLPMVCQSLQSVAAYYKFDWNAPHPYRAIFRERLFDYLGRMDDDGSGRAQWYTRRSRFGSQIPLEYAYAAWGALATPAVTSTASNAAANGPRPDPPAPTADDYASYRRATPELLRAFAARRLEAMEHIAATFHGNRDTEKRSFALPDLARFAERAETLAQALDEFVTIERHVTLGGWKSARLEPPERRVLAGLTLLVRYDPADQDPGVAARNRENARRHRLSERYRAEYRATHPDAAQVRLPREQRDACAWSQEGLRVRLRLETAGIDCGIDEALALTTLHEGQRVVVSPRTMVDSRLPVAEQRPLTPTPRSMLYDPRADIVVIATERDADGRVVAASVEIAFVSIKGGANKDGFVFSAIDEPLEEGALYTLDEDPTDWYGSFCKELTRGLCDGQPNTLHQRLVDPAGARTDWPEAAARGQARFLEGLDALQRAGAFHPLEDGKRAYIAGFGDAPTLLVQGPPGTGKSYATAFALLARLQGAMAAGRDYRVAVSCKTHAATDVLLENVLRARERLRQWTADQPAIAARFFDARLLDVPLFRVRPRSGVPEGVIALPRDAERAPDRPRAADAVAAERWCVVAAPPAGMRGLPRDRWGKDMFGHGLCQCLVLDEVSQMNLPEAALAALPLDPGGHLIVVGDHRQMPPIVTHDWGTEPRRTFKEFRSYESLFLALLATRPPIVKFEESFRLHADMAAFLRQEIYRHDGIAYHSRQHTTLRPAVHADPLIAAVLAPEHPIVVVTHDEAQSQLRNPFEEALMAPLLAALTTAPYDLGPEHGLGVVVPHRAQRAALRERVPELTRRDPATGLVTCSAVDTVERFQGDERDAILVGATESDRAYLLTTGEFLLDPRRLTVALSRARHKMVLVASRAVFGLFSPDEETFAHAQLWKNLLRRTCTIKLWAGERDGHHVEVWGNAPAAGEG